MPHNGDDVEKVVSYFSESQKRWLLLERGSVRKRDPDFRSPGGVWTKYQPVYFQDFLASEDARRRYWKMRREGYHEMKGARPNEDI